MRKKTTISARRRSRRSGDAGPVESSPATARHTHGPWRAAIEEWRRRPSEVDFAVVEHDMFEAIEIYANRYPSTREEHHANAHLIAGAPDLYEACRDLLDRYDNKRRSTIGFSIAEIRRAIAKAEGR